MSGTTRKNLRYHTKLALGYFFLAASLGVMLRIYHWQPLPVIYKYMVHAHSHIALLGWVYVALMTLLYTIFLTADANFSRYRVLFWITQGAILGMLFTFPFQGYALGSIIFSTLFIITSYVFAWLFIKNTPRHEKNTQSYRLVRAALYYMLVSSLGPLALGIIMNSAGPASHWYRNAIYFYLHFQYNGWMMLAILGLLVKVLEMQRIAVPQRWFGRFFLILNLGIILSFFLSVLWANPPLPFFWIAGLGAILQVLAYGYLFGYLFKIKASVRPVFSRLTYNLLKLVTLLFFVKILLQLMTAIPYFARLSSSVPDFIIGYLHWTFLGVISLGLFIVLDYFKLLYIPEKAVWIYLFGFAGTECLIFYKGIAAWKGLMVFQGYYGILAISSMLLPMALAGWFICSRKKSDDLRYHKEL